MRLRLRTVDDPSIRDRVDTLARGGPLSRGLLEAAPDAMVVADGSGSILLANAAADSLFGYRDGELAGQHIETLIPERYRQRHKRQRSTFARRPRRRPLHSGLDLWGCRRDGSEIPVEISLSPLHTDQGMLTIAAIRDATPRKQAEQAMSESHARSLQASEQRYRQILEATPDGVWRVDRDNVTDYVNARMVEILGYSESEMIGQPIDRFMDKDWLRVARSVMDEGRNTGSPTVVDGCFRHKSGAEVWCRISTSPLFDLDGAPSGSIAVMSDITQARQHEAELRATEKLLVAATHGMTDGMLALDESGRVTLTNRAAERMLGWGEGQLNGRSAHGVLHGERQHGTLCQEGACRLLRAWDAEEAIAVEDDLFLRRDGDQLPVSYTTTPLVGDGTKGMVVFFRDISERKQVERRRAAELEELSWVGRVRDALENDGFVLYAQPIVDIATRAVLSHELLIRMVAPGGVTIPPDRFLPAAERFDLVQAIDRWVAGQAISLAARGHRVEFNVSGRSVGDRPLLATIVEQLRESGADPGLLICEITETALAEDISLARAFVGDLTELGCQVALDDFGVGYGGFAYLKQLHAHYIKIDMTFIRDLEDNVENRHFVTAIVRLAKAFGQKTIAEGVERESTLQLLSELGVDQAQGYAIGEPRPLDALA